MNSVTTSARADFVQNRNHNDIVNREMEARTRTQLNLMGIHPNPSERIETNIDQTKTLVLDAKSVWVSQKPVVFDNRIEQCAMDGDNTFQFFAYDPDQHALLRYGLFVLVYLSHL